MGNIFESTQSDQTDKNQDEIADDLFPVSEKTKVNLDESPKYGTNKIQINFDDIYDENLDTEFNDPNNFVLDEDEFGDRPPDITKTEEGMCIS